MKSFEDIQELEKLIGQLKSLHTEIGLLARKSPNDAVNDFKLKMINRTVQRANALLGAEFVPYDDFEGFEKDDVPSNSDVTMVISQYLEEAERFRSYHVVWSGKHGNHVYKIDGQVSDVRAAAPSWSKK